MTHEEILAEANMRVDVKLYRHELEWHREKEKEVEKATQEEGG